MSFTDEYLELRKKKKKEETAENIAPLYTNKTAAFFNDDIAPVGTTTPVSEIATKLGQKRSSGLDFLQNPTGIDIKGRVDDIFEDGWQFGDYAKGVAGTLGDIGKVILGTAGDAGLDIVKGVGRLGEGIGDLLVYGAAGIGDLFGADEWADEARQRAQESMVDNMLGGASDYVNQYSVLGRTSDSILEGIGQVGGILATGGMGSAAGFGSAGVTALTTGTMGLSGMGSGMGEAYQSGASDLEALKHGLNSGAADALSELIFGGLGKGINALGISKGLTSADDIVAKLVGSKFKNQMAKNVVEFGIKAGAEGLEEVIAGVAQAYSKYNTYLKDEGVEFEDVLKDEKLLEQFIVGAFTSGIAQSHGLHIANKTNSDFVSGFTQNEQAVIKKETENRIAEQETDGKKLTSKEKAAIEAQVEKDLEKGYISTDTIEEVLGGENYFRYKETVDSENALEEQQKALQEEFDTLNKMKQSEMTGEQIDRRAELKEELADIKEMIESTKNHSSKSLLKQRLSESVFETVKGERLAESYNERTRKGQAFEADLTKYDVKQRAVIEKAVESGILNNTNRTHEFVDMVAKISADKGVLFDFTNNQKLKESSFAVDGKFVNGYFDKKSGTIGVNIDSAKAVNTVVGHEITHVLEGTEFYDTLRETIVEYAKSKGDYQARIDALNKLYDSEDVDTELVADLVGDYLFTDSNFIHKLSTENRNIFQKIYDEIKYLCKVATAGSKEARELERVKKAFEDAYRGEGKASGDTKHSLSTEQQEYFKDSKVRDENGNLKVMYHGTPNGDFTVFKDGTYFTENKAYADKYQNPGASSISSGKVASNPKTFEVYLDIKKPFDINDAEARNIYINDYIKGGNAMGINPYLSDAEYDKITAIDWTEGEDLREFLMENGYDYDGLVLDEGGTGGYGDEVKSRGKSYVVFSPEQVKNIDNQAPTSNPDIRYSLSDSDGKQLTKEQAEYFKDSKVRDAAGNLLVVYHGTPNGSTTIFDKAKTSKINDMGQGIYFSTDKGDASEYMGKSRNKKLYSAYVNIQNPFVVSKSNKISVPEALSLLRLCDDRTIARDVYQELLINAKDGYITTDQFANTNISIHMTEMLAKSNKYDGIIDETVADKFGLSEGVKHIIAIMPNQIKSTTNEIPTADPDIRFSLSESVEETKDLIALHNMQSSELIKTLELGGLPMPSVAIIKAEAGHEQYGDVSLVFPKETIDPQKNKANKVYGGDAWTPTYPKIEYKPKESVEVKIREKYYDLSRRIGYEETHKMARYVNELEESLNRSHGEAGLLEDLYNDRGMMQIYLQDIGKGKVEDVQREIRTELSDAEVEMNEFFIKELGADVVDGVMVVGDESPATHRRQYWEEHGEKIQEAYKKFLTEKFGFSAEDAENVFSNMKLYSYLKLVRDAHLYRKNGRVTIKTEKDHTATDEAIRQAAGDGYKDWIDGLFKGVEEKTGIRNNADYFTPSGNRRKWEALHWENTLENVVRVMKQQDQTGADAVFGVHKIFSTAAKEYGSIADIKADSHRLHTIPQEEYEAINDSYTARMQDIATRIMDKGERNQFIAMDNAMECIVDAVRTSKTKAGILRELKQYRQLNVTDSDVDDIVSLVNDIANMPTGYFEAKPQRAVGFDEVAVFVIPRNADVKLKQELLNKGYNIAEYDPDVEGDRQKVVNQFEEYKFSLSNIGETPKQYGSYNVYGKDIALETAQDEVAPISTPEITEETAKTEQNVPIAEDVAVFPDDLVPTQAELDNLYQQKETLEGRMSEAIKAEDIDAFTQAGIEYDSVMARIEELENEISETETARADSLNDADAPPEMEAPYYGESEPVKVDDPFEDRDWYEVGNRKVKAYMYENPEVKPFFQAEAMNLLGELNDTTRGERWYNDEVYYESGGEKGFGGVKRHTSASMEELLDSWHMSYADIEKGLNAIIEDNGAENIAAAKKIEFMLNDRLLHGYKDFYSNGYIPPNQEYIDFLEERQINEYRKGAFDSLVEQYAPITDEVAPIADDAPIATVTEENTVTDAPVAEKYEAIKPKPTKEPKLARATPAEQARAEILTEEPKVDKKKGGFRSKVNNLLLDKGMIFEDLSLATGNRELQARWNSIRYAEGKAQKLIGEGNAFTSSLKSMQEQVEKAGKTKQFYEYLYHMHNVDRMTLEERFEDTPNKAVFGDSVTADVSRDAAAKLENANPEFKQWANEIYTYNKHLRELLVEGGVISSETAKLWETMYPHYVPIRRLGDDGLNINVPLDTGRTGINAPIKRAKGGNRDILPLFDTMAQRTLQTYKAIAKNRFGVELKNTLGTTIENEVVGVDEAIDSIDTQDGLLQEGKNGKKPTFTVFENGEKVTFEITDEMYDAMKPTSDLFTGTSKALNTISNIRRGTLTEYNPWFLLKNAVKDVQDVLINSQHAARTYASIPSAIKQMRTNGHWYQEYMDNGGDQNTYFDNQTNTFAEENKALEIAKKVTGLDAISKANNIIERLPRLAEYIASRKAGRSIDVSMLDAARVTTNFAAGGDATKWLNRNGATFLNASVQGAVQQARNIREAKANGLKGWASLAAKYTLAGLPALLLNHLLWDDDDEYDELSDYVKENYYIVGKYGDGKFVRIPKGRTVAVIQNAFEQMENLITGNDEVDLGRFLDLVVTNLSPNNPLDNNIISPIIQVANNETWYGEDLVPMRLQDLPAGEQYDESTDSISRWLGETFNISPVKANYLLDQYSGVIGDTFLPMLTPEAESGDNSFLGNMIAPLKDMFSTDSVMNNQNVSDFYDTMDKLTTNAKASKATDEDVLMSKYMNSVNAELSELYKQKREIQSGYLPDDKKYEQVREIQRQIDSLAKNALGSYENVNRDGDFAEIGGVYFQWYTPEKGDPYWRKLTDEQTTKYKLTSKAGDAHYVTDGNVHYRLDEEGEWTKISDRQLERQEEVTKALGITPDEYWSKTDISFLPMSDGEYEYAFDNPDNYAVAKAVGGYDAYKTYSKELYDIKADKDENGKSISGSRKEKVIDYINNMDADYGEKIILFKSEYPADDTYNNDIIEYLNSREDISYEEMETILKKLGFNVSSDGTITWD